MQLLEPGDMREVSQLHAIAVPGHYLRGRPSTDGTLLALSRRPEQEVQLLNISDLNNPKPIREYQLAGHPGACRFWIDRLVIRSGYEGLLVERLAQADGIER